MSPRDTGFSGLHCLPDIVPQGQTLLPLWWPVGSSRYQKGASVSLVTLPLNPTSTIGPLSSGPEEPAPGPPDRRLQPRPASARARPGAGSSHVY